MVLKSEVYKALEDVVGRENISEAPLILGSYAQRRRYRFEALTLPQATPPRLLQLKLFRIKKIKKQAG
jgi:hypothetical protein